MIRRIPPFSCSTCPLNIIKVTLCWTLCWLSLFILSVDSIQFWKGLTAHMLNAEEISGSKSSKSVFSTEMKQRPIQSPIFREMEKYFAKHSLSLDGVASWTAPKAQTRLRELLFVDQTQGTAAVWIRSLSTARLTFHQWLPWIWLNYWPIKKLNFWI